MSLLPVVLQITILASLSAMFWSMIDVALTKKMNFSNYKYGFKLITKELNGKISTEHLRSGEQSETKKLFLKKNESGDLIFKLKNNHALKGSLHTGNKVIIRLNSGLVLFFAFWYIGFCIGLSVFAFTLDPKALLLAIIGLTFATFGIFRSVSAIKAASLHGIQEIFDELTYVLQPADRENDFPD